ncbi:hypothetical protein SAMN05192588_2227 [Nonlabens sp. Hel1_33_55]|uniref:hypothetical protein n=1 Tax=Nonlabens sp. Hel1_33_55 TaxID=1336802 RepID=UPI000875C1E5|nr:hypothetical protein [Nonlabens sp. Hel1_33_55]SCY31868.1 hypothetical protein SAMN05192588_2227 [Nonlabens sp. Hel1_33_55]
MKKLIWICAVLLMVTACKEETTAELDTEMNKFDQLTEQTMEVHDEVMPEMSHLMELSMEIDQKLESAELDDDQVQQLFDAQVELDDSHDAMMDWMKDYTEKFPYEADLPSTQEEMEEMMPVLQSSYEEIKRVQSKTETAIQNAEELLANS